MREIKFRVWDKTEKKMYIVDGYPLYIADGRIWEESTYCGETDVSDVTDRYELMQYTGIKDKNGKEIYEGDTVEFKDLDCDICPGAVEWQDAGYWAIKANHILVPLYKKSGREVIGNIYEQSKGDTK